MATVGRVDNVTTGAGCPLVDTFSFVTTERCRHPTGASDETPRRGTRSGWRTGQQPRSRRIRRGRWEPRRDTNRHGIGCSHHLRRECSGPPCRGSHTSNTSSSADPTQPPTAAPGFFYRGGTNSGATRLRGWRTRAATDGSGNVLRPATGAAGGDTTAKDIEVNGSLGGSTPTQRLPYLMASPLARGTPLPPPRPPRAPTRIAS